MCNVFLNKVFFGFERKIIVMLVEQRHKDVTLSSSSTPKHMSLNKRFVSTNFKLGIVNNRIVRTNKDLTVLYRLIHLIKTFRVNSMCIMMFYTIV